MVRIQRLRRLARILAIFLVAPLLVAGDHSDAWRLPVDPPNGAVVQGYDPPRLRWSAGHRGVDLAAPSGADIYAAAAGVVTYAGRLAGRGVVVVNHGRLRSTYEPVAALVKAGDQVNAGEVLGTLTSAGSHCAPKACLHWGVKLGQKYVDPLAQIATGGREVRLLPLGNRALTGDPPPRTSSAASMPGGTSATPGAFRLPVASPHVTSPFGMRRHPVTGVVKLHDGTDFHAPCGSPVHAASGGVVRTTGEAGAYGLQVTIDHGMHDGTALATSYSHLSRIGVRPGQSVAAGSLIGWAGTTGMSTGCHLHFMVLSDSTPVDPTPWLKPR